MKEERDVPDNESNAHASCVLSRQRFAFTLAAEAKAQAEPLRIAIAKSFLTDQPKGVAEIATDDFKSVMKKATGLDGNITSKLTTFEIADKLSAKQLDFGIFHAHEFAWAQKQYPELKPLMIAADKQPVEQVFLIVHKKDGIKSFADLRGKKIDVPLGTKEHCRLFLHKHAPMLARDAGRLLRGRREIGFEEGRA